MHLTGCKAKWDDPVKDWVQDWAGSMLSLTDFFPSFSYMSPLLPSQVHPLSLLSIKHSMRCFLFRTPLLRPARNEPSVRSMSHGVGELPAKAGPWAPNNVPLHSAFIEQGCACLCIVHHVTVGKKFPRWPIHSSKRYFICVCNPAAWWLIHRQKVLDPHPKHEIVALGLIFSPLWLLWALNQDTAFGTASNKNTLTIQSNHIIHTGTFFFSFLKNGIRTVSTCHFDNHQ